MKEKYRFGVNINTEDLVEATEFVKKLVKKFPSIKIRFNKGLKRSYVRLRQKERKEKV